MTDKFINHKQAKMRFRDQGSGPVLVFLHGFLESLNMWERLIEDLKSEYRVISIDLPGHGQSECLGYIHKMTDMAEVVKSVVDELGIDTFFITGHSMGGYVALAYAEMYRDDLNGICLMNSTALADSEEKRTNRDRAIYAVKESKRSFIKLAIPNLFKEENRLNCQQDIEQLIQEADKMDSRGIIAALEGMKIRENREQILSAFGKDCLMIIGKDDPILDAGSLKRLVETHKINSVILEGGHMSHVEEYEVFSYNFIHFIENK